MFAMTLSALMLGIAAEPSHTDARTDKVEVVDRLCRRMECTRDQLASIETIVANVRVKIAAERADDRDVIRKLKLEHGKDELTRAEHARLRAAMKTEGMEMDRIVWGGINNISDVLDREQAAMLERFVDKHGPMFVFRLHDRSGKDRSAASVRGKGERERDAKLAKGERERDRKVAKGKREHDAKVAKGKRASDRDVERAKAERKRAAALAKAERKATKGEHKIDRRAAARNFTARQPAKA